MTPRTQPTPLNHKTTRPEASSLTLMDHLHEIRARLFWIILFLLLTSGVGYLFQDHIMAGLMQPLGGQKLVYLTPIGGFNFLFKVSMYVGIGLVLPVIIYHLYRFLEPLMDPKRKRSAFFYIVASFLLAFGGGAFAYFAGLPAALHFLTSFNIQNVSAMLTADSYLTFVITYVLGFAALFQIPLVLMIINTIKPLPPKKLMGFQRFVILAAFIVAAVISPTPDITNQTMLAVPIIVMYQIGVLLVWIQSRKHRSSKKFTQAAAHPAPQPVIRRQVAPEVAVPKPAVAPAKLTPKPVQPTLARRQPPAKQHVPTMDVMRATRQTGARPVIPARPAQPRRTPERRPAPRAVSIDGFAMQQS